MPDRFQQSRGETTHMPPKRDTKRDKAETRRLILDLNRPPYPGGENWLGHGRRDGKDAVIDYLLLDGATMERLLLERGTEASVRSHFQSLKTLHDLPVTRGADGKYRFDRAHLGIPESGEADPAGEPLPEEVVPTPGLLEGAVRTVTINAYERNPEARRRCVAHYGPTCVACGFNFAAVYGSLADGYIQVHHIKPLSEIGEEYEVDPVADLRPVCPNCHAVIHLGGACRSVEEVRSLFTSATVPKETVAPFGGTSSPAAPLRPARVTARSQSPEVRRRRW
jgi:hypothetical protein